MLQEFFIFYFFFLLTLCQNIKLDPHTRSEALIHFGKYKYHIIYTYIILYSPHQRVMGGLRGIGICIIIILYDFTSRVFPPFRAKRRGVYTVQVHYKIPYILYLLITHISVGNLSTYYLVQGQALYPCAPHSLYIRSTFNILHGFVRSKADDCAHKLTKSIFSALADVRGGNERACFVFSSVTAMYTIYVYNIQVHVALCNDV